MPFPNNGANWTVVSNGVNHDSVPATVPRHSISPLTSKAHVSYSLLKMVAGCV
jgi:hypothetical protein